VSPVNEIDVFGNFKPMQTIETPLSRKTESRAKHTSQPIAQSTVQPAWTKAIAQTGVEFAPTPLPVIQGQLPSGLRGSLYRNGPGRLQRGQQRVGHWFDGDGAILAVHLTGDRATGVYRFVQTEGYQADEAAGKFTSGSYGMVPPKTHWLANLRSMLQPVRKVLKHPASVSALALDDRLLALWDQGHPYALNAYTLETWGLDRLGQLEEHQPYAAHYKRDGRTGEIFSFGVTYDFNPMLNLYRSDATGQIRQKAQIPLHCLPLIHDFVLAGPYLIFFIPPVRLNPIPVITHQKSFGDSLAWKSNLATQILIVDRQTFEVVSRGETDPWFSWHVGNGYVDADGNIVADLVRYEDFSTNEYLKEVGLLKTKTPALGTLWQFRIDPRSGRVVNSQEMLHLGGEFPVVAPREVGYPSRYTYLSVFRPGDDIARELWGTIARVDYRTGESIVVELGANRYPTEPIYAPDADDRDRGWILTIVYDGDRETSEVWIYDADRLDREPVCQLALPETIPIGYHGTWKSSDR
jgi:all-trans-8'-apo-beta-carotenal 15,15'-oxygenase